MLKRNNLIYTTIIALLLIIVAIFFWNNYKILIQKRLDKPIECGIENCHGLDITCGSNVPEACTEIYQLGDNCRRFVNCQIINDSCELGKSPKFDSCKSCVTKCEQDYPNNPNKLFECESVCVE